MSQQLRDVISNNGLKIKLYIIDCPWHPIKNDFVKNPKYDRYELSENLNDSKFVPYDLYRKRSDEIFYELENNLFIGYSCLVIVLNMDCEDLDNNWEIVIQRLKANKYLRYKSKLILTMSTPISISKTDSDQEIILSHLGQFLYLFPDLYSEPPCECSFAIKILPDFVHEDFECKLPENTTHLHLLISKGCDIHILTEWILQKTYDTPLQPLQEIVHRNTPDVKHCPRLLMAPSRAELYFYSINPALAIIINQYHFTSNQQSREGSDQDVLRLVRELKVAAIPYILIENCNKEELLEILNYLRRKDFWPLKKFLFFMMSHGDSNGNIHTTDDKVHIMNDIVKVIQNNESLKTCTQLLCMVNCRGKIEAAYADFDDFDAIMPTDNSCLHDSTIVLYSVPDQMKSPRSAQHGTPLIASFCKNLRTMSHDNCIKELINNVNKNLKHSEYYKYFPNNSVVEFVCKDTAANQSIKPIPIGATNMIRLLQSIATEMEQILGSDNDSSVMVKPVFYITGNLCKNQMELNPWQKKYFSPQLNNDRCELVEEFEKIPDDKLSEYIDNAFGKRKA